MAEKFRTMWKGFLRLSLVTIPVKMVTATRAANEIHFHQIDRKTNQRIRYQKVVPGKGEVAKEDIVRGYEVEPGHYVLLEDEELDSVKIESRHTIELTQFVEACEIDPLYFEKPYYLLPDGDVAEEGYRTIRDALREMGRVGIGQQSVRGRENLVTIHPAGDGLLLETLRYDEEVKEADEVFADIGRQKLRGDLLEMAKDLIDRKSERFDPSAFENHYAQALRELVDRKIKSGKSVAVGEEEAEGPSTVVDFMEALRRSVAKEGSGAGPSTARKEEERAPAAKAPAARARGTGRKAEPAPAKAPASKTPASKAAQTAPASKARARTAAAANDQPSRSEPAEPKTARRAKPAPEASPKPAAKPARSKGAAAGADDAPAPKRRRAG
ncbi:Ku protein [Chthonobacter rhizosphaerae]|uniref:non-homologous end joining protein Ku n=1 Tax=Chthonobacter rhizosphaerae TaxID=2735553 RepID=UPI0015EE3F99|nr:Ku protein [Chthonobacter rhizosphaerae]